MKPKAKTYSVRVTDNASGRSVSFTIKPAGLAFTSLVEGLHRDAAHRFGGYGKVTKITDRRHARR